MLAFSLERSFSIFSLLKCFISSTVGHPNFLILCNLVTYQYG